MRIISLLPAATELVAQLGAEAELVAITHECDYPPSITTLPRVTASPVDRDASSADIDAAVRELSEGGLPVFTLDANDVARLKPDVIITQSLCEVCAVRDGDVRSIAGVLEVPPAIVPMTGTTLATVRDDFHRVATVIGREQECRALLERFDAQLLHVHATLKAARAPRPRVAVIEWLDPIFAAGHWTPELVRRAGGIDVLAEPGAHSVRATVDFVREARPELLVFAPCGFDVHRAAREADALLSTGEWRWAADLPAFAIDGNALTSRPGPRLADAVSVLASIFAPGLFELDREFAMHVHGAAT